MPGAQNRAFASQPKSVQSTRCLKGQKPWTDLKRFATCCCFCARRAVCLGAGFDFAGSITGAAANLVTNYDPIFKPVGDEIFTTITIVMIIVCGKKVIFSTSRYEYQAGLAYTKSFVGHWLVGWTCLAFYDVPLWGGMSIHQVIPMIASFLAAKINTGDCRHNDGRYDKGYQWNVFTCCCLPRPRFSLISA